MTDTAEGTQAETTVEVRATAISIVFSKFYLCVFKFLLMQVLLVIIHILLMFICENFKSFVYLQMTDMTGADTEVGVVEDMVVVVEGMVEVQAQGPDNRGVKATGNVIDAEPTTLLPGAAAMHVEWTKPLNGATEIGETGVMVTVGAAEVEVVMVIVVVVVVEGATEELLHSSPETGIAQTAAPTILQADKHATSVVLTNEHYPSQTLCQERLCRTLCRLAGTGCIECLALGSAWLPMVLVSFPRVWLCWLASWLLVELLRVWHLLQLWLSVLALARGGVV